MPHASPYPPIDIPNKDLYSFLHDRKDRPFPDNHPAFICANTKCTITIGQARDQSQRFGVGLKSLWEWRKGDVMAIFSTNHIEYAIVCWGVHWAGGVLTTANPSYTVDEFTSQLKDSGTRAICTIPAMYFTVLKAATNAGIPKERIIFLGEKPAEGWPDRGQSWKDIFDPSTTAPWRKTKINAEKDAAFFVYSSGTTGNPKGVMLSHKNIVSNILQVYHADSKGNLTWEKDKILAVLPFFHVYGLTILIHLSFYAGNPVIVMERFDIENFCKVIQEEKPTYTYIAPPIVLLLAKHPSVAKYDLSSMRMLNCGAAPLREEISEAVYARIKIPVKQAYGMSELSPATHMQRWEDWRVTAGSVGKLLPNMLAKYMSEDGTELEAGQTGELWLKGPNVMLGYLNNPTATAASITPDGYYKTGDVGHVDIQGNFYITDRIKELIKYNGFQVAPAELEGILSAHPKVDDCAVLGMFMPELETEVPRAFVVLGNGMQRGKEMEEELLKYMEGKVAKHKWIRGGIRFVEAIPKSQSGKILRNVLKNQILEDEKAAHLLKAKL
ncbi:acetyl-CoA synthetase-like protein [Terfezia boudieri ATCC MYA-4762]|uniref:Acetyl-CoA synthetase-like protein n=1 Tax=Terfezia boudieri ATCC MYA-4762 TaxID=1051890 RepID=A0A3N4LPP6_9PEZI|nr:acetyl-CoA synthetase-like protein [Terfezia boudieri ATCC MYA-4762]